uniref:Small ribosomal subunit protein uS4c n=1 Tax=Monomorphina aenigmatica TaxID=304863 RepID=L0BHS3_MONAE|nr:ribosomal protein S4 [Monomorphina aenigmatica]AFZ88778.1 ribosomal protein S4 [Monomorphina aenigmatica]
MARYRGPRLRIVRRIGKLPGLTRKVSKKLNPPGQHGSSLNRKLSQFNIRLREKQKLRYHYGVNERQLLNYIKRARKKKGSSGRLLLTFLEMRLDNIVFRLGFAPTVVAAKQFVNHGHILVNGRLVNIPSFACQPKDIIRVKLSSPSQNLVKRVFESSDTKLLPQHLSLNKESLEGKVNSLVNRKSISLVVNELLVIEYYSRKL